MSGQELREKLYHAHIAPHEVGKKLGMCNQAICQALRVADVKTGFLERICEVMNLKMSFFYPEIAPIKQVEHTNVGHQHAKNLANGDQTVNEGSGSRGSDELISQLMSQLAEQQKQIAKLTDLLVNK